MVENVNTQNGFKLLTSRFMLEDGVSTIF